MKRMIWVSVLESVLSVTPVTQLHKKSAQQHPLSVSLWNALLCIALKYNFSVLFPKIKKYFQGVFRSWWCQSFSESKHVPPPSFPSYICSLSVGRFLFLLLFDSKSLEFNMYVWCFVTNLVCARWSARTLVHRLWATWIMSSLWRTFHAACGPRPQETDMHRSHVYMVGQCNPAATL